MKVPERGRFDPLVILSLRDGSSQTHSESFFAELNSPQLVFKSVSLTLIENTQYLVTQAEASDDVDISYVQFSVTGLRASELRAAGGVVDKAKATAFADSDGSQVVYPVRDAQGIYTLSLPVTSVLDADAIAHDGVVLVDLLAVDSSGNQKSASKVAFTGGDVVEQAEAMRVTPKQIVFTNLLETASIVPSVQFQFRGLTVLPGPGSGVSYTSSHPDLIAVTPGGLVYPLGETAGQAISITVAYPGLDPIDVPVEVDPTKSITGLQVDEVNAGGRFVLDSLNTPVALPEVFAVFNDGSRTAIGSQFPITYSLDPSANGILDLNSSDSLFAYAIIPETTPIPLKIALASQPDVTVLLPVIALDALPEVSMELPSRIQAGSNLLLEAQADDDVAVREVRFFMDGSVVGVREQRPYAINLSITDQMINRTLEFKAVVTDSAGQSRETMIRSVTVEAEPQADLPEYGFEKPVSMQRLIEDTPVLMQIAVPMGPLDEPVTGDTISYVNFYMDGRLVGETYFPIFEERLDSRGNPLFYELWRLSVPVKPISTNETSVAIHAEIFSTAGASEVTASRLVRVLGNQAPTISIAAPLTGSIASVGQNLNVVVAFADDTLPVGADVVLLVNNREIDQFHYEDQNRRFDGSFDLHRDQHRFTLAIVEEQLGTTLNIRAKITDFHEEVAFSQVEKISVKRDQPPSVALNYPSEGARFVAGLPIELRAQATDDVQVARVDFYVNGQLIGSDAGRPYSAVYKTINNITQEQILTLSAKVVDSKGQQAESTEVKVTLGRDEEAPVVNLVSPEITATEGGEELAEVIEDSEVVLKVAGYDNVGVTEVILKGVRKVGSRFELTGDSADILSSEDFEPQQIPGALKAFSALKMIKVPLFSHAADAEHDLYPVEATAIDETGNESTARATIAVFADRDPVIVEARQERNFYFPRDSINIDLQARDDKAVSQLEVRYFLDGATTPVHTEVRNVSTTPKLIQAANVQAGFLLDLAPLALSNSAHTVRVEIVAEDNRGHRSTDSAPVFSLNLSIVPDTTAPLLGISAPVQGSVLYHDNQVTVEWKAVDDSQLALVQFLVGGGVIHSQSLGANTASDKFFYKLPAVGSDLRIDARAVDIYGNEQTTPWDYSLISDEPPTLSIRSPAAGSRLVEGESFTMTALAGDNRQVNSVTFFIEIDGVPQFTRTFNRKQIAAAEGSYLSAAMRVPHRPEAGEGTLKIGVRATDDAGLTTEEPLDLVILEDEEPPLLAMETPAGAFSIFPGDSFSVKGAGDDNHYIDSVVPVLVDEQGAETVLEWQVFSRSNQVKNVTVPNPITFGTLIVGSRFYTHFQGRINIPKSYMAKIGQTFKLKLRAADFGVNRVDTLAVDLTIRADEEAPVINIISPEDRGYENQLLEAAVNISDNIQLDNYSVFLFGREDTPLATATGLMVNSVKERGLVIDTADYMPLPPEGATFTLVVEATDASGNFATKSRLVTILPDKPPQLSIVDELPESDQVQGDLMHHTLRAVDDYATAADQVHYFPLYTSLKGMGGGGSRDPTGHTLPAAGSSRTEFIRFNYPEAQGLDSHLMIAGQPYVDVVNNLLTVRPRPKVLYGNLVLDFGPDYTVRYQITTYRDDACSALVDKITVDDPAGVDMALVSEGDFTTAIIKPELFDSAGNQVESYIDAIRIDSGSVYSVSKYSFDGKRRGVVQQSGISLLLKDQTLGGDATAFLTAHLLVQSTKTRYESGHVLPLPAVYDVQAVSILGHISDRLSHQRGPQPLHLLAQHQVVSDDEPPLIKVTAPLNGRSVVPMMRFDIKVEVADNTQGLRSLQLFENNDTLVRELGGSYKQKHYTISYEVPRNFTGGNLELLLVATDNSGHSTTELLTFPIHDNEKPQLSLTGFSTYKVGNEYKKVLSKPDRLNYGEFWVRVGEPFKLSTTFADDAGLASYVINRVNRDGTRVEEARQSFGSSCPKLPIVSTGNSSEILFEQVEPTTYELILTDAYGNQSRRTFLVHPLSNVSPSIRITSPADNQYIVAGTFRVKVGIVAADDRELSFDDIELYANGVKLPRIGVDVIRSNAGIGGEAVINQAFDEIYDGLEQNYSVEVAQSYGLRKSPFSVLGGYTAPIPSGLIKANETVTLLALIRDSDNAIARHEITINAAPDEINPEVAIMRPEPGFGPPENSDFTLGFRAYDNVKINSLELYTAYGVRQSDGSYVMTDFSDPIRTVSGIADRDYLPISTVNIDTPEYKQLIRVKRIADIMDAHFDTLNLTGNELFDVWVRVITRDVSGNTRTREVSYPVRVDERPVVDIVTPVPGATVVEEVPIIVNVNAFDDVGISSLRLTASHNGSEIFNLLLRQPPYTFQLTAPAFDAINVSNNKLQLHVEAIDTYGAAFGDPDKHSATEDLTLTIIHDEPPTVAIGLPVDGSEITEGDYLLVQVNGVDDVGLDRVNLQVDGLITGGRSFTDTSFPYEFLVAIPYGQAGSDIALNAGAVELRYAGNPRTATTPVGTTVHVRKDEEPPDLVIDSPPVSGATVVEKRALSFVAQAADNVAVSTVRAQLFVDLNQNGSFTEQEAVSLQTFSSPPYTGSLRVETLADYLGEDAAVGVDQLAMQLTITASDGAGNQSVASRPVTLKRNSPPQVTDIQVLDQRGFSLGTAITEVTEGRGIVINVVASDPEVGVDSIRLFQSLVQDGAPLQFEEVGNDQAAPFQTHIQIPVGHVGEVLSFQAEATDIDGYVSPLSAVLNLTILADQPPTAEIVSPDNDESVIIEGQDIEVFVEAIDDLGIDGIDRVLFYLNDSPVDTVYNSYSETSGSFAQEHIYRALISPPEGASGFVIQAEVFDIMGHSTRTGVCAYR